MAGRGSFLGGSTIMGWGSGGYSYGPAGTTKNRKGGKKSSKKSTDDYLQSLEQIENDKVTLRHFDVSSADHVELGTKTSGWTIYRTRLRTELAAMAKCNMHRADQVTRIWNSKGFRTGSDRAWTPRLVKIAKQAVREGW